jgi:hypothetical protein
MSPRLALAVPWLLPGLLVPAALLILWREWSPPSRAAVPPAERVVAVRSQPLPGNGTSIGPFRLAGAVRLESDDAAFGGISGLAALADGRLLAITDAGQWLALVPVVQDGRLAGVSGAVMGAFTGPGEKWEMDGEAIAFTPAGETLISLEQQHRIMVFNGVGPPRRPVGTIFRTATAGWLPNGGGEALAVLADGSLLWISEQQRLPGGDHVALWMTPDGKTRAVGIPGPDGFSPTDAAVLDDGRLLLLHRFYNGLTSKAAISLVDLAAIRAGGTRAASRVLAQWGADDPWPVDNMEGLALAREGGKPVLYVASDDNFNPAQASILLRLELNAPL